MNRVRETFLKRYYNTSKQYLIIVLAIILFISTTSVSLAQAGTGVVRVAPNGSDSSDCGSVAAPCQTLQYAVDLFQVGDTGTVLVAAGTYFYNGSGVSQTGREVVRIAGKNITIKGGYTTSFIAVDPDANVTIIDGQNARRAVSVEQTNGAKASLNLSGVTLTNGRAPTDIGTLNSFGGGLDAFDSTITLSQLKVVGNSAIGLDSSSGDPGNGGGGGLSFRQTTVSLNDVELTNNTARGGAGSGSAPRGGLGVGGAIFTIESAVSINGLTAQGNNALGGNAPASNGLDSGGVQRADGLGGALALINSSSSGLRNITLDANLAQGGQAANKGGLGLGGGLFVERNSGSIVVREAAITNNHAIGGVASAAGSEGGAGLGGGVFSTDSALTLDASSILSNRAEGVGGVAEGGDGSGGGIYSDSAVPGVNNRLDAINVIVGKNVAVGGSGGTAGFAFGGGIFFQLPATSGSVTGVLTHLTLAGNSVTNGSFNQGAALYANGVSGRKAVVQFSFGIVADHTAANAVQANGDITFSKTLWNNNNTKSSIGPAGSFQDVNPSSGSPEFVASASTLPDYHIKSGSAAREAATTSTTNSDVDGESRPFVSAPGAGDARDLGADEFYPSFYLTATVVNSSTVRLNWGPSEETSVAGYKISYQKAAGAADAAEGASPFTPSGGALTQSATMSGLTMDKPYTITIQALDGGGGVVETSNTIVATPIDLQYIYLPSIVK